MNKGRISEIKEFSFVINDEQTGTIIEVKNEDVTQVKTKGNGLSTGAKILIEVGIAAAVVVLVLVTKPLGKSPFPKCTQINRMLLATTADNDTEYTADCVNEVTIYFLKISIARFG